MLYPAPTIVVQATRRTSAGAIQGVTSVVGLDAIGSIMRKVLPAARVVIDHPERIVLSARDTERVLKLLENPPKPSAALLAAARRRRARRD